ncbi:MAG: aspartate--tRNA ligase [Chthonomonadales bacterium]|nr:aspartate--tRNA ligase [Chthonomonadales bacterium]
MEAWQRTDDCGALRLEDVGRTVTLNGWANGVRDHGDLAFIDLRDRTGMVQLRADAAESGELVHAAAAVRPEHVLSVTGEVRRRAPGMENPRLSTGDVEVEIRRLEVLNPSRQPLPFQVGDESQMAQVSEELRVRYRYLDLRRPVMQKMLRLRHEAVRLIRRYLDERGFLEIETPIITKSTPEGARDYLVPYRLQAGQFYALPQSPQQYKQLLMVAGCDRYYQIARCFRDEAQRADRQPEFTQLDLEMAFVTQEDVLRITEGLTTELIRELSSRRLEPVPFARLTYDEAMDRFGTDKPDLRFGLELANVGPALAGTGFAVFRSALQAGGMVKALRYPGGAVLSRKEIDDLAAFAREFGAKGLAYLVFEDGGEATRGPVAKHLAPAEVAAVRERTGARPGDLVLFAADTPKVVASVLGRLRNEISRRLRLADPDVLCFCWVTDFPLVEWSEEDGRWDATHHPFTMPHPEDLELLESDPGRVRALCYDIVCNGMEWASGSIRIHRSDIQARVFALLGIDEKMQRERFGHILEAFQYGAPPHGGIAPGIDRLLMQMLGTENIREVIAFPKMGGGTDPMMGAPSPVEQAQLDELHLRVVLPEK